MGVLGYTKDRSKDSKPEGLPISCFAICSQLPSTRYTDINGDGTTVVAYNHYDLERGDGLMKRRLPVFCLQGTLQNKKGQSLLSMYA